MNTIKKQEHKTYEIDVRSIYPSEYITVRL